MDYILKTLTDTEQHDLASYKQRSAPKPLTVEERIAALEDQVTQLQRVVDMLTIEEE